MRGLLHGYLHHLLFVLQLWGAALQCQTVQGGSLRCHLRVGLSACITRRVVSAARYAGCTLEHASIMLELRAAAVHGAGTFS
eukprot:COSAG02_NODE_16485_length_1080_cov_0.607543_2_plen_81_part_01